MREAQKNNKHYRCLQCKKLLKDLKELEVLYFLKFEKAKITLKETKKFYDAPKKLNIKKILSLQTKTKSKTILKQHL